MPLDGRETCKAHLSGLSRPLNDDASKVLALAFLLVPSSRISLRLPEDIDGAQVLAKLDVGFSLASLPKRLFPDTGLRACTSSFSQCGDPDDDDNDVQLPATQDVVLSDTLDLEDFRSTILDPLIPTSCGEVGEVGEADEDTESEIDDFLLILVFPDGGLIPAS
mmetsp:Transcript_50652/g.80386  ORF Transcript_50652/g.80386 Transcript_50652/m.80386 type:complete len:164 (-) Transcript_50652:533-1024(-)